MGLAELLVPQLLSVARERSGFHVCTCDAVILPTSAVHSGWRRCLLRTEACGRPSAVHTKRLRCLFSDLIFFNVKVYDRMPPVRLLYEPLL